MTDFLIRWYLLAAALAQGNVLAHPIPAEIVFVAPLNHTMPMARWQSNTLAGGILMDLGQAIASRLHVNLRFISVPAKRVAITLAEGRADAVCYVMPGWIEGDFVWTRPFLPDVGIVVASKSAREVHSLEDLAGVRVGTVLGYRYRLIERVLGEKFVRDDGPSMQRTLEKMELGRVQYGIVERTTMDWHLRSQPNSQLRVEFVLESFHAQCALARSSTFSLNQIDQVIGTIVADGTLGAILARYRGDGLDPAAR